MVLISNTKLPYLDALYIFVLIEENLHTKII